MAWVDYVFESIVFKIVVEYCEIGIKGEVHARRAVVVEGRQWINEDLFLFQSELDFTIGKNHSAASWCPPFDMRDDSSTHTRQVPLAVSAGNSMRTRLPC